MNATHLWEEIHGRKLFNKAQTRADFSKLNMPAFKQAKNKGGFQEATKQDVEFANNTDLYKQIMKVIHHVKNSNLTT